MISHECHDDCSVDLRVVTVATVILARVLVETAIFGRGRVDKNPKSSGQNWLGQVQVGAKLSIPSHPSPPDNQVQDCLGLAFLSLGHSSQETNSVTITPQPVLSPITPHSLPKVQTPTETPSPKPPPNKKLNPPLTPFAHVVRSTKPSGRSHAIPPHWHPSFPTIPAPQPRHPKGPSWLTLGVFCGGLLDCVFLFSVYGYLPALGTWLYQLWYYSCCIPATFSWLSTILATLNVCPQLEASC